MSLTLELNVSRLVIQLETLENRLQNVERSAKLKTEAQQIVRKVNIQRPCLSFAGRAAAGTDGSRIGQASR